MSPRRFECSVGGAIAAGRRRLRRLLLAVGLVALTVGALTAGSGRIVPGLMALAAGALTLFARRMSADLDPLWLELADGRLAIQMRRQREVLPVTGLAARRLNREEVRHLGALATTAGVTVGTGGFDSHRLGEIDLYATDLDHAVIIDRGESALVVTPDRPEEFLDALSAPAAAP